MSDEDDTETEESTGNRAFYLYLLMGGFGMLISGLLIPGFTLDDWKIAYYQSNPLAIPPQIFLYAFIGAMAYGIIIFLTRELPGASEFSEIILRIPAALFIVIGVYLLGAYLTIGVVFGDARGVQELAFLAYITGLLIDQTLNGLRTVATRLYPGSPEELNSISKAPEWTDTYRQ